MAKHIDIPATVAALDQNLFEMVKGIDILEAVAPQNYREQKQIFFDSNFSQAPAFKYGEHKINVFQKKRSLYQLPVENLPDPDLTLLYSEVIESYVDKLDQYSAVGTADFIYESLRYYGEPTDKDIRNANFILHVPDDIDQVDHSSLGASEIHALLERFAAEHHYDFEIRLEDNMIANALASGRTIKINRRAQVSTTEAHALAHHELGVHLVTTLNGQNQPLKILSMGSPVNTTTQEGLAILCEYLAGYLTLPRLKVLALRVIAVQSMLVEKDFRRTFMLLKEQYNTADDLAFTITARVYRGGGLTKDYLYLSGFHQMLNSFETHADFQNLLCGKVSFEHLDLVTRLIKKAYLVRPKFISPAIAQPTDIDAIKGFLAHAIK